MSSKFNFINTVQQDSEKKKFQLYEIKMGFEVVTAAVPYENAELFKEAAVKKQPKSVTALKKLLRQFDGTIEQ